MVERQKAMVGVLNDTRRDDVNKDPLGGDGKLGQLVENVKAVKRYSRLSGNSPSEEVV
jgi:hypothetical protein